jgi:hypothetical protein
MPLGKIVQAGQRFGVGVVVNPDAGRNERGHVLVSLQCDSGNVHVERREGLWAGRFKVCGCRRSDSYNAQHKRVAAVRGRPASCAFGCTRPRYHWAFNGLGDRNDPQDYISLCVSCHKRFDVEVYRLTGDGTGPSRWN